MRAVSPAYYNEIDEKAAAWLRELIRQGHIAPGDVDTRSIEDVCPDDLRPYTQCHFFAGIGVWSYALRRAGWSDDRPVWTGSCPCQPFSAAGKGGGFDDERHLWPAWHWLVGQLTPAVIFGEQVASKDAEPWLDLVQADMEALGYALGAIPFPSAGVGAPHIRDRLYWVADADDARPQGRRERGHGASERAAGPSVLAGGLADSEGCGTTHESKQFEPSDKGRASEFGSTRAGASSGVGGRDNSTRDSSVRPSGSREARDRRDVAGTSPVNGLWRDADWLFCRDGKWRPVEPGTFPLAHGAPARVGRLRGYGNAINAEAAKAWIESYLEAESI